MSHSNEPTRAERARHPPPLFSCWMLFVGAAVSAGVCVGVLRWLGQDDAKGELTTAAALTFLLVLAAGQLARRRFRISIRTVMIITAIVGVVFAYVAHEINVMNREEAAVEKILGSSTGRTWPRPDVTYRDLGTVNGKWYVTHRGVPIPLWIKEQFFGEHYFTSIYELRCPVWPADDEPAAILRDLRCVEQLDLTYSQWADSTDAEDIVDFPLMPGLKALRLDGTHLTSASAKRLSEQPDLERLEVFVVPLEVALTGLNQLHNIRQMTFTPYGLETAHYGELAELSTLRELRLDATIGLPHQFPPQIPNECCESLSASRSIESLNLLYVSLPEGSLQHFATMPQLRKLSLLGSHVPDDDLKAFQAARPDVEVVR